MPPKATTATTSAERQDFIRGPGFILYNDVTEQLLGHLSLLPLPKMIDYQRGWDDARHTVGDSVYDSIVSLYVATDLFRAKVPLRDNTLSADRADMFGFSDSEEAQVSRYTYDLGLDDLDFPWHFSPAVASAVVHSFVESGAITAETAQTLTLKDWCSILSSDWFIELNHDLAHTGFSVYSHFGKEIVAHRPNALRNLIGFEADGEKLLNVTQNQDVKGMDGISAELNPAFKAILRERRKPKTHFSDNIDNSNSNGCPVARKAAMLPENYADTMPRATNLQAMGRLTISDKPNASGLVLASQEVSAIGRTLQFIGGQLVSFEAEYGDQLQSASKPA